MLAAEPDDDAAANSEDCQETSHDRARLRELFRYFQAISRAVRGKPPDIESNDGYDRIVPRLAADPVLNSLAQLGALQLGCERAFISLIDDRNQHIVAEVTRSISLYESDAHLPGDELCMGEVPLDLQAGVCAGTLPIFTSRTGRTIDSGNIFADQSRFIINDFTQEALYKDRPYVTGFPHMRYYAEVPLKSKSGYVIGSYCVVDNKPRKGLDDRGFQVLTEISTAIMRHLDLIKTNDDHIRSMRLLDGLHNFVHDDAATAHRVRIKPTESVPPLLGACDSSVHNPAELGDLAPAVSDQTYVDNEPSVIHSTNSSKGHGRVAVAKRPAIESPTPSGYDSLDAMSPFSDSRPTSSKPQKPVKKAKLEDAPSLSTTSEEPDSKRKILDKAALTLRSAMDLEGVSLLDASINSVQPQRRYSQHVAHIEVESQDTDQVMSTCRGYSLRPPVVDQADKSGHNPGSPPSLPKHIQQSMIHSFPRGQIFTFDDAGPTSHTETVDRKVSPGQQAGPSSKSVTPTLEERTEIEVALHQAIPEATSIAFVPLWNPHSDGWTLSILAWTTQCTRVLLSEELSYCRAFGNTVLAELIRVELEATDRAKSDFISSISHELRSPLHGILAGTDFLRGMQPSLDQSQMIDMIENCSRTLLDTVDHILYYSKINNLKNKPLASNTPSSRESTTKELKSGTLSNFDISLLVEEVFDSSSFGHFHGTPFTGPSDNARKQDSHPPLSTQKDYDRFGPLVGSSHDPAPTLTFTIRPEPSWLVRSDVAAWRRIVSNLVGNSLKYTSSGSINVRLSLEDDLSRSKDETRKVAALTVSDTGRGMSPMYLQNHMFTPFTQEDSLSGGIGLGLSIVRTLTNSMDGSIHVDSQLGIGTEIRINIPVEVMKSAGEQASENKKFSGRSVCLLTRSPSESLVSKRAIITAFETQATEWLQIDVVHIESLATATSDIIVIPEDDLAWLNEPGSKQLVVNLPARSCLLVLCAPNSQFLAPDTLGTNRICILSQPFGPQKMMKSLLACQNLLTINDDGRKPQSSTSTSNQHSPVKAFQDTLQVSSHLPVLTDTGPDAARHIPYGNGNMNNKESSNESESKLKRNLLLVDDNAINLKLLTAFAKRLDCTYTTAVNGLEALDAYRQSLERFDFVLMDLSMPVMDGFAATSAIRDHERQHGLVSSTVIALTGLGSLEAQQEAARVGIDIFMAKPVRLKELEKVMNTSTESSNMVQHIPSLNQADG